LQTVRHRFNIYESSCCVALALWRGDKHRKLVTRFGVIQREYNERFGLVWKTNRQYTFTFS